ncbi:bifunctional phosphoribosyl-AMP cyclohydrolase/phosphoribosyl-ATP diphosphatase HisIE [Ornithinimicrobium faecis]|uniref:Histidine biosynthesis bifunctional protein HisIE n=1 Tax=Ornithinimicrobium faecis TaxID=2934158 RepID=A0ABY4YZ27_9MICO|nr:bifunctional phosphoribosyl-AMP cyclohydrolase/phosphoribosyl-ATP diphosphatase HisIE [Ornithinimicrobium sp. HY1793]USQ82033.1 bifunctional phosphoribosyl-AMP cyclohydrolase/phosphoribosyl-ATP diphosphatase HisIE [Ornithinimicrobium sp. HY1793]
MSAPLQLPDGLSVSDLAFAKQDGLLPAIVQHHRTGRVLMLGYQDAEALTATLTTGLATFFSRSRQEQWVKGATSDNYLRVTSIQIDCDRDTVLLFCDPDGPTCHTGSQSCFDGESSPPEANPEVGSFIAELEQVVVIRDRERPQGSYTTTLLEGDIRRIAQKVGEEGVETALAAVAQEDPELIGESADLIYHLLVLLRSRGLGLADVEAELRRRHG